MYWVMAHGMQGMEPKSEFLIFTPYFIDRTLGDWKSDCQIFGGSNWAFSFSAAKTQLYKFKKSVCG